MARRRRKLSDRLGVNLFDLLRLKMAGLLVPESSSSLSRQTRRRILGQKNFSNIPPRDQRRRLSKTFAV